MYWMVTAQTMPYLSNHSEDCIFPKVVAVESSQYRVKRGSIETEKAPSCLDLYNQEKENRKLKTNEKHEYKMDSLTRLGFCSVFKGIATKE